MRIAVVGGGPGGLYFSILMRKIRPDCEVTVYERRAPTDAFKFFIADTEHGVVQAHAYPYDAGMSTFIVEMHERTWKRLGLDQTSIDDSVGWCSAVFADALEGHRLYSNNSRWINFVTVRN